MTTLNLSNYTTVWDDNFTKDKGFNSAIWDHEWGNGNDFVFDSRGLTLTSYQSEGWSNAGFIQPNHGASNSQGYGLYQATAYVPGNQGIGICILLWPSTDGWPGPELDMLENWSDPTSHTGYATFHWQGANNSNGQDPHQFSVDMTKPHTYSLDWQPTSLTYYIDGTQIFQVTGAEVPKDAADGGQNEAFGAEVTAASSGSQPTDRVSLTISDMKYSAYTPGKGGASISVSAPGSVQEATVGAGVNVTETVTATGVTTAYEAVFTSANVAEAGWQAVALNAQGVGSFTSHFANSGDYVKVVNSTTAPTVTGASAAIAITDQGTTPPTFINSSAPGTVREASVGAGVNVTETFGAPGLSAIYEAVFTSANVAEENWVKVALNSAGTGTATMHFQHSGDYIVAVNDPTTQSIKGWSTPITITDGATTKPTNVALTGDNLTAKTAVGAVVGTLSATDANPVTYSLTYNQHNLFSIVGNQLELAQAVPATPMSAYYITVNATDSTGGSTSKQFKVGVQPAPAAATAQISAASVSSGTSTTAAFLPASHSSIVASAGGGDVTFGTDNESFSAAGGAWNYSFGSGAGLETIGNFDATTGDTINIAASLQGALHESVAGGSTTLSFGDATHGIVLQGVSNFATSQIHWG